MRFLLGALALLLSSVCHAGLGTSPSTAQLTDDARAYLKTIYKAQWAYRAYSAKWSNDLKVIGAPVPSYLAPFFDAGISFTRDYGYVAKLTGKSGAVAGKVYSIDANGTIKGTQQYATAAELIAEIRQILADVKTGEEYHYNEFRSYTTELPQAGIYFPKYLASYGTLTVTLTPQGYKATFQGSRYPIAGREFSIDQSGTVSGTP